MRPQLQSQREHTRRYFYGSPYVPGPGYWLDEEQAERSNLHTREQYGSPYAPGPTYMPYEYERAQNYGYDRYGSPYAPGPGFWGGRMDMPYGYDTDRYGSPYAPGPSYPEGPYHGIGPRNYRRSDQRIFEDVCDRLMHHGRIDASDIDVKVTDGEVTLSGSIDSQYTKRMAEDAALSVLGVQDVHNLLKLNWAGKERSQFYDFRTDRELFKTGMVVVGKDGSPIGEIIEIRSYDFKVKRSSDPDIYVPFGACLDIDGSVILDIPAEDIDKQSWPTS